MDKIEPEFDAPIAGMSLTHELGARPWQSPAQYTNVDEVIQYYIEKFQIEDAEKSLLDVLEMGVPVSIIANTLQLSSVMEGVHSIDTGLLVLPVLMELIMYIGDKNKVKYDSGLKRGNTGVRNSLVARAIKEFKEEEGKEEPAKEKQVMVEEPKGLMARRTESGI
tara:strand:- start:1460 stop:1954 length:495 start_codon:yes stop_codon:yes gene_type:complete